MYAIVEIKGQQFKVEEGRKLFVHHIKDVESGAEVEFDRVMLVDREGSVTIGTPVVSGDKVLVFHKKRRKGYRKLNGHRQQFTEVRVKQVVA